MLTADSHHNEKPELHKAGELWHAKTIPPTQAHIAGCVGRRVLIEVMPQPDHPTSNMATNP